MSLTRRILLGIIAAGVLAATAQGVRFRTRCHRCLDAQPPARLARRVRGLPCACPMLPPMRAAIRRNAEALVQMMEASRPLAATAGERRSQCATGGVRRVVGARRGAHAGALRALRRPAGGRRRLGQRSLDAGWRRGRLDVAEIFQRDASQSIDPDWRLYARAASDDKAGVFAILAATDALKAAGLHAGHQYQAFLRWRGGAGIAPPARSTGRAPRTAHRRSLADCRWPRAPERSPATGVRRARRRQR